MVAVSLGLVDAGPVVEGLRATDGLGCRTGRIGRILGVGLTAGVDAADRLGKGAVGLGLL